MLSGALEEDVIEEGETNEEFTKRKRDEIKKILHEGKVQGQFVGNGQENCTQVFRKVDKEWVFWIKRQDMLFEARKQSLRTLRAVQQAKEKEASCLTMVWPVIALQQTDTRLLPFAIIFYNNIRDFEANVLSKTHDVELEQVNGLRSNDARPDIRDTNPNAHKIHLSTGKIFKKHLLEKKRPHNHECRTWNLHPTPLLYERAGPGMSHVSKTSDWTYCKSIWRTLWEKSDMDPR